VTPSAGGLALRDRIREQVRRLLAPPPTLSVSEWADRYRTVPSYSADAGQWVTARTPYLREIMDSFSEPGVNRVVFKKCARIGATEAGLNIVLYFVHQDPSSVMIVQPTVDDAKDFSKEQLAPSIEETPVVAERVSNAVKDSKNTITAKVFPGGSIVLGGANSPRFFRRRTVRVLILEEVNGYGGSSSAKGEGDQIKLAEKRTETLGYRRKIYLNSTPTTKGECRISREFAKSDQRFYHVPCPHCGHAQRLVWERLRYKDLPQPGYQCVACERLIDEREKDGMLASGAWVVTRPLSETRGYHLNALYSPFARWTTLVQEWIDAQGDPEALQVFANTALGEEWEDRATMELQETVQARAAQYEPAGAAWRVPRGACVLLCGVDKQPNALHYVVRAYGPGEQSWLVDWGIFFGDTSHGDVWAQLDDWRTTRTWTHEHGATMQIRAMAIDSGDDPDPVYQYTKPRLAQGVFAVKGAADPNADIAPKNFTRTRLNSRLYLLGTQAIKKRLLRRVGMIPPTPYALDAGPMFLHFNERAGGAYFAEFFSQKLVKHEYRGKTVSMYVKRSGQRDESLDCEVYAYALLHIGPVAPSSLTSEWERVMAEGDRVNGSTKAAPARGPERPPVRAPSAWLGSGGRGGGWRR